MNTIMKLDQLKSVQELSNFLSCSQAIAFTVASSKDERYQFVESILKKFPYKRLSRPDKGVVFQFLIKMSGYSRQ